MKSETSEIDQELQACLKDIDHCNLTEKLEDYMENKRISVETLQIEMKKYAINPLIINKNLISMIIITFFIGITLAIINYNYPYSFYTNFLSDLGGYYYSNTFILNQYYWIFVMTMGLTSGLCLLFAIRVIQYNSILSLLFSFVALGFLLVAIPFDLFNDLHSIGALIVYIFLPIIVIYIGINYYANFGKMLAYLIIFLMLLFLIAEIGDLIARFYLQKVIIFGGFFILGAFTLISPSK